MRYIPLLPLNRELISTSLLNVKECRLRATSDVKDATIKNVSNAVDE